MLSEYTNLDIPDISPDEQFLAIGYSNILRTLLMSDKRNPGKVTCSHQVRFSICSDAKNITEDLIKAERKIKKYQESPTEKDITIETQKGRIVQLELYEMENKNQIQKLKEELQELKKELSMRIEEYNPKKQTGEVVRGFFRREVKAKFKISEDDKIIYVQVPFGAKISNQVKGVLNKRFPGHKIEAIERI